MSEAQRSIYRKQAADAVARPITFRPTWFALQARLAWVVFAGTAILLASIAVYPNLPRTYQATSLIILQPTDRDGQPVDDVSNTNALDESVIETYRDMLASRPLLQPLVQQFRDDPEFNPAQRRTPPWLAQWQQWFPWMPHGAPAAADDADLVVENNLRTHMVIQRYQRSYALQVGFTADDPEKAAVLANTLANAFIASQVAHKRQVQADLTRRLDAQVALLRQRARDSEAAVNGYRVASGLIHTGERLAAEQQLAALSGQLAKATADAEAAEDRARSLQEMQRQGSIDAAPEVMASPVIQAVKEKLIALNSSAGPSGMGLAVMSDLKTAIGGEAQRIVRAAQTDAAISRRHADELQADITRIDGRLVYWQEADRQLRDLRRIADADDAALNQVMAQSRAQAGRMAMMRADAEIMAPAVPPTKASFPNLPLYALGTLMMVMLACGLILVLPGKPGTGRGAGALAEE